jgi:hypothetical protein
MQTALPFGQEFLVKDVLLPLAKKAQFKKGPEGMFNAPGAFTLGPSGKSIS